ncbi:MAG: DUF2867 domain-containing protein [Betaproteobacteria bacterium]
MQNQTVTQIPLPRESSVREVYPATNLADAFAIALPPGTTGDPEVLARFIFAQTSRWISGLMAVRDAIVGPFGLKTSGQLKMNGDAGPQRVGIFRIYGTTAHEIILGEDDSHLDFRLSVLHQMHPSQPATCPPRLIISTVVHCHNALGRAYIFVIAPFHRLIVQSMLRRAARAGWPGENPIVQG